MKALRAAIDKLALQEPGSAIRSLLAASVQRQVLARVDTSLVLIEGALVNTASGEYRELGAAEGRPQPAQLAQAAQSLMQGRGTDASILLLLPPSAFMATRFSLGISGEKVLRSALKLQAHMLVPACEEDLLLGLHGNSGEGVALWYPAREADELFAAFADCGLFLAAVMPRTLALPAAPDGAREVLRDDDARHSTLIERRGGALVSFQCVRQADLKQADFATQWRNELERAGSTTQQVAGVSPWRDLRRILQPFAPYCFLPAGAEQSGRNLIARAQRRVANIAAGVLVAAMFLPFVNNWLQGLWLQNRVDALRVEAAAPLASQAAVYALEDEWGAVAEYPRQNIAALLLALNELIDSSLSSFAIDKGVVDITGFAGDPALLIEQMAEREDFYNVGQSRSTSGGDDTSRGQRFGIRFNVSGVDFPGYEAKYPASTIPGGDAP